MLSPSQQVPRHPNILMIFLSVLLLSRMSRVISFFFWIVLKANNVKLLDCAESVAAIGTLSSSLQSKDCKDDGVNREVSLKKGKVFRSVLAPLSLSDCIMSVSCVSFITHHVHNSSVGPSLSAKSLSKPLPSLTMRKTTLDNTRTTSDNRIQHKVRTRRRLH